MKRWLLVFALIIMLALVACDSGNQTSTVSAASAVPVTAAPSTPPTTPNSLQASGPIVVENQVDILALRAGVISAIQIDVGRAVHKGDLLASLDDRQIVAERDAAAANVRSAKANLDDWQAETGVAESDYTRAKAMHDAGINTQEELDHAHYKLIGSQYEVEKAKQDLDHAQDTLRALELEVEKTRITAPFDGVVARRYTRVGQSLAVGDRLFWITAVSPLQVKFTLPERFLGSLSKGQTVTVSSADAATPVNHAAKVIDVSPVVDPASGTIEVLAQIEGAAPDLRPGMLANIHIDLPR